MAICVFCVIAALLLALSVVVRRVIMAGRHMYTQAGRQSYTG